MVDFEEIETHRSKYVEAKKKDTVSISIVCRERKTISDQVAVLIKLLFSCVVLWFCGFVYT